MGGEIEVTSKVNVGTSFTIKLPLEKSKTPSIEHAIAVEDVKFTNKNILLVEDNEINQAIATAMLASTEANIVIANNGKEALQLINDDFDVVLMDIQMPEMDGLEAMKQLKKLPYETPVIAMTANVMTDELKSYQLAGFVACVAKPVERENLLTQLTKYIG